MDHKQAFIDYLESTKEDPKPWSEHGENWVTGAGLQPVEFPLIPRWDSPDREHQQHVGTAQKQPS